MVNWKYKFEIKDLKQKYTNKEISIEEFANQIIKRIRANMKNIWKDYEYELNDIICSFECVDDEDSFDEAMSDFYNWGDQIIPENSSNKQFMKTKMCWINLSF